MDVQRSLGEVQLLAAVWRKLTWVLSVSSFGSGLGIVLGPSNSRTSVSYQVLAGLSIPYTAFAALLMVGAVLVVINRTAWLGNLLCAIGLTFWAGLIVFISLIARQPASFGVAFWTAGLGAVHMVILYGRVYRHQFHVKVTEFPKGG